MSMEKSNFDDLIQRYVTGQVSEQERIKMDTWLDIMKGVNTSDLDLSPEDEEKLYRKITSSKSTVEEIRAFRPWERHIATSMAAAGVPWKEVSRGEYGAQDQK